MYDPNADRRKEFQSLMQNSIAPLPEPVQFAPMQPMQLAPMQEDTGPSPISQAIGQIGSSLINRKRGGGWGDAAKGLGKFKMPQVDL